jgi:hypothetical protein
VDHAAAQMCFSKTAVLFRCCGFCGPRNAPVSYARHFSGFSTGRTSNPTYLPQKPDTYVFIRGLFTMQLFLRQRRLVLLEPRKRYRQFSLLLPSGLGLLCNNESHMNIALSLPLSQLLTADISHSGDAVQRNNR